MSALKLPFALRPLRPLDARESAALQKLLVDYPRPFTLPLEALGDLGCGTVF